MSESVSRTTRFGACDKIEFNLLVCGRDNRHWAPLTTLNLIHDLKPLTLGLWGLVGVIDVYLFRRLYQTFLPKVGRARMRRYATVYTLAVLFVPLAMNANAAFSVFVKAIEKVE